MAIQVTGLFQHPQTKQLFENPYLQVIPHLTYAGIISMDVNLQSNTGASTIGYSNVERSALVYDRTIGDSYDELIVALETYIVDSVSSYGNYNPQCTYQKWDPHYVPPAPPEGGELFPGTPTVSPE